MRSRFEPLMREYNDDETISSEDYSEDYEEYRDVIYFKSIQEMDYPVLSPHTGHIYERNDLRSWVEQSPTDPIDRDKTLTEDMFVPGLFVKQESQRHQSSTNKLINELRNVVKEIKDEHKKEIKEINFKHAETIKEIKAGYQKEIQELKSSYKKDIEGLTKRIETLEEDNKSLKKQLKESEDRERNTNQENKVLRQENTKVTQENQQLREENAKLKRGYINPLWSRFGAPIDAKLKKGSTPERTEALKKYAEKVKSSTDEELKNSVNNTQVFTTPEMKDPRFFGCIVKTSKTHDVVTEFQQNVNDFKGW